MSAQAGNTQLPGIPLQHEPICSLDRLAKDNAQVVFAEAWRLQMLSIEDEEHASCVLADLLLPLIDEPQQRHASVAATFVSWLGTNCGLAFEREADRRQRDGECASITWLHAWAQWNRRINGRNHNYRALELILAPRERFTPAGMLSRAPDLTADDYEVVDYVVLWLGGTEGQRFRAVCRGEIEVRRNQIGSLASRLAGLRHSTGVIA